MHIKNIFKFVAIIVPLVFSQVFSAFATPVDVTYTYDGATYPGDDENHDGTKINATNTDVVLNAVDDGHLDGDIIMTGGKLQLYTGFIVNGTINSDVSGENELQFEQSYNLGGNIGDEHYFGLTALQNSAAVDLDDYDLHVKELYINGGTISDGNIIIHENGFIDGIAGFAAGNVAINGSSDGVGEIHFVRDNQDPGIKAIQNDIGTIVSLNNIQLSESGEGNVVDFDGYRVNSNTINIGAGATLITSGSAINSDVIIADGGDLEITAKYNFIEETITPAQISGAITGLTDGVGVVNIRDNFTLGGNIGTANNSLAEVNIINNGEDDDEFNDGDYEVNLSTHSINAEVIKISGTATLITGVGTITGEIRGETAAVGNLRIAENFATSSDIGVNANLNAILVNEGKTFAINHAVSSSSILNAGVIDFGSTARQIDANIYGIGVEGDLENNILGFDGTATFNARDVDHTINGNFETTVGDTLAMNINSAATGSFTANARAIVANGTKLALDISGLELAGITAGTTEYLVGGNNNSVINQISSDNIDIGAGYDGSKSVGALTFGTVVDGDSLRLAFTQNTNLRTINVNNIDVTPAFDLEMSEAAVVIEGSGNLNLGPNNVITNGNVTISEGSTLTVGSATINGFITGSTAGAGTLTVNGEGAFVSNGNIGYGLSLAAVNVGAGKTLDIATNNNFINASAINLGANSILNAGTGAIDGEIVLGENSTLTYGAGVISGSVNGAIDETIVFENSETAQYQFNGTLILTNSTTFNEGVGTLTSQVNGSTVVHAIRELNLQDSDDVRTYNLSSLNAIELKIGSNAVVNFNGVNVNVDRIVDTTVGVSSFQTLNITNSALNMLVAEEGITLSRNSTINIGNNVEINGNINQLNLETLESSVINISSDFVSNGNFTSNDGVINVVEGAEFNLAENNNSVTGYNIVINDDSTLITGTGAISGFIDGEGDGRGILVVDGDSEFENIGATHSLNSVRVNAGKTMNASNISANQVLVNGNLVLDGDNITGNLTIEEDGILEVSRGLNEVSGAFLMNSQSIFTTNIVATTLNEVDINAHGRVSANGEATISNGAILRVNSLLADFDLGRNFDIIDGIVGSEITAIADENIYVNDSHLNPIEGVASNKLDLLKFSTSVVNEGGRSYLRLNVSDITESKEITVDENGENGINNHAASNFSIINYVATNIREGAELTMGSGEIRRNVYLEDGATLNTGTGAINGDIAALSANSQGTVNVKENLTLAGNIGAEDRAINLLDISENKTLTAEGRNIIATTINIEGGATLEIDNRLNQGETIYGVLAADFAGTLNTNISLGQSFDGEDFSQGTLDFYNASDELINANVDGAVAGSGDVILRRSGTFSNLVIGATSRINELSIESDANISLASSVNANSVYVYDNASLTMLDGTTTRLNDRLIIDADGDSSNFYLGGEGGEGATLTASTELTGGDDAYFHVNRNSIINGDVVFTDSGYIDFFEGSTLNGSIFSKNDYDDEATSGDNGDVYISGNNVTITGDITGVASFNVSEEATFAIAAEETNTDITALEINVYGSSSFTTNSELTATNFEIRESSSLTTTGKISAGHADGEGYINTTIKLGVDSTLTLNSGSSLHATIDDITENEGRVGHGSVVFGDAQEESTYDLYGNIGGNFKIASVEIGQNVSVAGDLISIKSDSMSLEQNSNLTTRNLSSSDITVDTRDINKGISGTDNETSVIAMDASFTSSLNLISGLVTGSGNKTLQVSRDHGSTTTITVGQDALRGENDSGAVLSNSGAGKNIINLTEVSGDITITITNKLTGTLQTNAGEVINLSQNATRTIEEVTESVNAILNLTNDGLISSDTTSVNAIDSNFRSTITNSETGEILGNVILNSTSQAILNNNGDITGDIEISSGSEYNDEENTGGSYIAMDGGTVTGNIKMYNAGTSLRATGGSISGDVTMHHDDQYVRFNGETLSGNITSDIAEVDHAGTVYISGNAVSIGGISKVENLVVDSNATFNAGDSNISVANIDIEEGSTLQTTSGDIIAATSIDIKGGATLSINNSEINWQDPTTYTTLAANADATENATVNLGRRITVGGAEDGTLNIGNVFQNSIHANVNGLVAGHGNVTFSGNASLNNLSIGATRRINQLTVNSSAEVVLGSSVSATTVFIDESNLTMLDDTTTTTDKLTVRGSFNYSTFTLGSEDGEGATLISNIEIDGETGADFYVNQASQITGDVVFTNSGNMEFAENSTLTGTIKSKTAYENEEIGGDFGNVVVKGNGVTISGDISGINQFEVDNSASFSAGEIDISAKNINLQNNTSLTAFGNLTATEAVTVGENAYLEANENITASTLNISDNSSVIAAGRISGAGSGGVYNNATIRIGLNSTLNLNDGSSLYAAIDGNSENSQDPGRGEVVFKASDEEKTYNLYADIGNNHGIASISVESNIEIDASEVTIKTDSLLLQQNSNLTTAALYSSNVTVDTNDEAKGVVSVSEDDAAIYLNTQSSSTLNIISGLVTGVAETTLQLNTAANASATITVGQDALEDGDSNAKLSNTSDGSNIINHSGVAEDVTVTINNKATGTIETNSGTVIFLTQEEARLVDEETQAINATLNLTNAGIINSGSSSVYAINTNFKSTITNLGTGTITGKINLNTFAQQNILTNSGTINGNIEISSGSLYGNDNTAGSYIETAGTINGDIAMYNAGTNLKATGGVITGNVTMYDNDQYIRFTGGADLDGNISGDHQEEGSAAGTVYISANGTSLGRISNIASLTIDNNASFTATANIGATSINLENNTSLTTSKNITATDIILQENATLSQTAGDIVATAINLGGNSSFSINNSAIDLEDEATYTTFAANSQGTARTFINLGQRIVDEEVQNAAFNIGTVANNSIHANVNGIEAGQGNVTLNENVTLNNLSIGADNRINKFEISSANVVFGSSVKANDVVVTNGNLTMSDGTTTNAGNKLTVTASTTNSFFSLGQEGGSGATLSAQIELRAEEGTTFFNVNKDSEITGGITFTGVGNGRIDFAQGSTLNGSLLSKVNYSDNQYGGDNGDAYIQGDNVYIAGDIDGINSFNLEQNVTFDTNGINIKSASINLNSGANLSTTSELTAGTIIIATNASVTTSGKIWNGYSDEEGYRNSEMKIGNGATLTLNSNPNLPNGTRLYATIDDYTENQEGVGHGTVIFSATDEESLYSLSGNIGGNYKIAAIEVGENVRIDGHNITVKTDLLSLAQDASFTNAYLSSSDVTIDTNDVTKGIINENDSTALNLNTQATSFLTLTSGLVTGVSNYVLRINHDDSATTTIDIGQDALGEGDSVAMLSNTGSGNNVIYLSDIDSSIALTINNKATGAISANEGGVIHLTQVEDRTSTFTLTNAGTITSGASNVSAINTNFNSTVTNSSTGSIVGSITLNALQQARLTNSGTITGDIEISGGSSYNSENGEGASYIHMNDGEITGNIAMHNAGANLIANGGTITGNVAMNHNSQFVHFNGGVFHGDITSENIGSVIVDDATFTKATTTITAANFTTNENSLLSFAVNSASASLVIIGEANIASSTTIKLLMDELVTASSTFTLIDATAYSGQALSTSNIIINDFVGNRSNTYRGLSFGTRVEDNKLILFALEAPIFKDSENQKVYEAVNNLENATGELAVIQDYLANQEVSLAQKEQVLSSLTPAIDRGTNTVITDNNITLANLNAARLSDSKASTTIVESSFVSNLFGRSSRIETLEPLRDNNIKAATPLAMTFKGDDLLNKAVWIQTFGSNINQGDTSSGKGYKANSGGLAVGIDQKINNGLTVGLSSSYSKSNIKSNEAGKSTEIETYQASIYTGYGSKSFFLNTTLGLSLNNYRSQRGIAIAGVIARADYSGKSYFARGELGKNFKFENNLTIAPSIMLTAARNTVEQYQETGAGTSNLNVKNKNTDFLEGRASLEVSRLFETANKTKIRPQVSLSYGYDFIGDEQKATANFVGQNTSFESTSANVAQGSFKFGTGVGFYTKNDLTVSLNYGLEKRIDYTAHSGWVRLRRGF